MLLLVGPQLASDQQHFRGRREAARLRIESHPAADEASTVRPAHDAA